MTTIQALNYVRNPHGIIIDEKILHLKVIGLDEFCSRLKYETFKANSGIITEENRVVLNEFAEKLKTIYDIIEGLMGGNKEEGTGYLISVNKILAPHIVISAVGIGFNYSRGYTVSEHKMRMSACITPLDSPDYKTITIRV